MKATYLLLFVLILASCNPPEEGGRPSSGGGSGGGESKPAETMLPLSPGVRVASHSSGGIAGISHLTQVTYDWKLIVVADNANFVRRLNGEEQKQINSALKEFATLHQVHSDDFPDGFASIIVAQGTGKGGASAGHAKALGALLNELKSAPQPQ